MIITIDGPVATGKSTIAKKLAHEIGFIYFDTGAMYRGFTYGLIKHHIDSDDLPAIEEYLKKFQFEIRVKHGYRHYFVEGEDVTDTIRGPEVTARVSKISAIPMVRDKLVAIQRELSSGVNAIFEGRDTGSVVFPNAEIKIFLTGDAQTRALRRYKELKEKYPEKYSDLTLEKTIEEIKSRDEYDTNRKTSPLLKAADAYTIDTTNLTLEEIVILILEYKDTKPYLTAKIPPLNM